jgi:hypothetical protein
MTFYVLANPREVDRFAVTDYCNSEGSHNHAPAPRCPVCNSPIALKPWLPPYSAELEVWGNVYGDIAFGPGNELLVTKGVAAAFKDEHLSGLSGFHDIDIVKVINRSGSKLSASPPSYQVVTIARSRAAIDIRASELIHEDRYTCQECRSGLIKRAARVIIEEGSWSGEDIFFARGLPGTVVTSERFKSFFQKYRINNGILIEADKFSFDHYPWENQ